MKEAENRWSKIEVGSRCFYGVIIGVWQDPKIPHQSWVFIRNDDPSLYADTTYTLYKFDASINKGSFSVPHFIPPCVVRAIQLLDLNIDETASDAVVKVSSTDTVKVKSKSKPKAKKKSTPAPVIDDAVADEVIDNADDDADDDDMFSIRDV
jgi:hypothetical protein